MTTPHIQRVSRPDNTGFAGIMTPCYVSNVFNYLIVVSQVDYDRRVRPSYGGSPVSVGVSLYVLSISDISEKFMDFTFDMYFRSVHTPINKVHIE